MFGLIALAVFLFVLFPAAHVIRNRVAARRGLPRQSLRDTWRGGPLPNMAGEEPSQALRGWSRAAAIAFLVIVNGGLVIFIVIVLISWAVRH